MNEITNQTQAVQNAQEKAPKEDVTLKSLKTEIEKLNKSTEKKQETIKQLQQSIQENTAKIEELQAQYDALYQQEVQEKMNTTVFRGKKKLTNGQLDKLLEIVAEVSTNSAVLDNLSVEEIKALISKK